MDTNEELLEFPCEFHIKAIGHTTKNLDATVVNVVRRHVKAIYEGAVRSKPSSKGKFTSVTVTFTLESREQLDSIYTALGAIDEIVMVL